MRRLLLWAAAAAALLAVAACAPAALGGSASNPFPATGGAPKVSAGSTVYVRLEHSLAELGLQPRDLRPALWVPSGYDSEMGDVTPQFGLDVSSAPQGWTFRLSLVRAERSSERGSGAFDSPRTVYALWSVYEVTAPPDALPGPYRFRGTLNARDGGAVPVRFDVEVVR